MSDEEEPGLFWRPLSAHFDAAPDGDLRHWLDDRRPDLLAGLFDRGGAAIKREYPFLSSNARGLIDAAVKAGKNQLRSLQPTWDKIDQYDRLGVWDGIVAGFTSEKTAIGAGIGTWLLPGIGSMIGAVIGGWMAGSEMDDEAKKALQAFGTHLDQIIEATQERLLADVWPVIEREAQAADANDSSPFWTGIGVLLAGAGALAVLGLMLAALGFGGYRAYKAFASPNPAPSPIASAEAPNKGVDTSTPSLGVRPALPPTTTPGSTEPPKSPAVGIVEPADSRIAYVILSANPSADASSNEFRADVPSIYLRVDTQYLPSGTPLEAIWRVQSPSGGAGEVVGHNKLKYKASTKEDTLFRLQRPPHKPFAPGNYTVELLVSKEIVWSSQFRINPGSRDSP